MRIYNEDKTEILEDADLTLGFLKPDRLVISEEQQEEFHYEEKHYDNGGVAKYMVVDKPYKPAEYEEIEVYVLYTEEELKQNKLNELTNWFDTIYPKYEQMLVRRKTLGIEDAIVDEFRNKTYHNIIELYGEAEVVAGEIRELRENNSAKI